MNIKHKWYDVIVAWASGEKIQVRDSDEYVLVYGENPNKSWRDFRGDTPDWAGIEWEWRVKPKTITKKYRMALVKDIGVYNVVALDISLFSIDFPAEREIQGFIRWVGDVVEVEIEL